MKLKEIRALAQLMESAGLSVIEISEAESRIRLERPAPGRAECAPAQPATQVAKSLPRDEDLALREGAVDFNRIVEVKSPMVGVFYASPSPEAAPYVEIGARVKKGTCSVSSRR